MLLWPRPQKLARIGGTWSPGPAPVLRARRAPGHRPEGYRLHVEGTVAEAEASDDAGLRNARTTFEQLVRLSTGDTQAASIEARVPEIEPRMPAVDPRAPAVEPRMPAVEPRAPAMEIEDWPDFPRRGFLLDISRSRVPTMATLAALVDRLASLKVNELQLYTEHTFAYRDHEEVWRHSSPMTPDEIRALDERCRERGIELVPNQQSLGHMHRWLRHDRYRRLAEVPDGVEHAFGLEKEPFSLCPTDPATLAFLSGLYDELLPCFSSARFHVGLDESFDVGLGRSKAACDARGRGRIHLEFLESVHALAAGRGRRIQFWGDFVEQHAELASAIPDGAIPMLWGYEAGHSFERPARRLRDLGRAFYVCPGTSSWQSVAGRVSNAVANLSTAAEEGIALGAEGYLVTDWGDRGHLQPAFASLPGLVLGAGLAWNAKARAGTDLAVLLDAHAFDASRDDLEDPRGGLGRTALELGDVHLDTGSPATNGSALFFLLAFAGEPLPHPRIPSLSIEGLGRARAKLRRISGSREMRWAAELLETACDLGIARLSAPAGSALGDLPPKERRPIAERLSASADAHRALWLETSRPGGLEESVAWIERVVARLS